MVAVRCDVKYKNSDELISLYFHHPNGKYLQNMQNDKKIKASISLTASHLIFWQNSESLFMISLYYLRYLHVDLFCQLQKRKEQGRKKKTFFYLVWKWSHISNISLVKII